MLLLLLVLVLLLLLLLLDASGRSRTVRRTLVCIVRAEPWTRQGRHLVKVEVCMGYGVRTLDVLKNDVGRCRVGCRRHHMVGHEGLLGILRRVDIASVVVLQEHGWYKVWAGLRGEFCRCS